MNNAPRLLRLAVLIDGENISADIADGLFGEIAELGEARLRRIYGNFSRPQLKSWDASVKKHQIKQVNLADHVRGKNTSDIALAIDAIDLFHIGQFDGFCLVSSDSDFTRLAVRLGGRGVDVYGFGEEKTPKAFREACRTFTYIERLRTRPKPRCLGKIVKSAANKPASDAIDLLNSAVSMVKSEDRWVSLAAVGKQLRTLDPQFNIKAYGVKNLNCLVSKTDAFEVDQAGGHARIRAKAAHDYAKSIN